MKAKDLSSVIKDLEKGGHLVRITEEVDPKLEMAAIHRRVYKHKGPAVFYERVKNSSFPAVSNLFGTLDRSKYIFRYSLKTVEELIKLRNDPAGAIKKPFRSARLAISGLKALPRRVRGGGVLQNKTSISALPQIKSWPKDGGPFITLPQVYTEDIEKPGVMNGNLGMYRIQLGGNDYIQDEEIGLHYQIHRGIGVHQTKANAAGQPLRVSIFVGGHPAHSLAAVMPLPEGLSELTFAGVLSGRRFRYARIADHVVSTDADFVITGTVDPGAVKPEGPFGDHLGYYSLVHDFPLMKVDAVYHRNNAIWPFTVVGRPPQEDTSFGDLIHELTGEAVQNELPGIKEVHAVDAAGVHPLLLAVGSERYTPYNEVEFPSEILTQANHILGTGQLSLAKYLFIADGTDGSGISARDIPGFFGHLLERVDWTNDLHFITRTSMDTLDYSGAKLNRGSKLIIAAAGKKKRELSSEIGNNFILPGGWKDVRLLAQRSRSDRGTFRYLG